MSDRIAVIGLGYVGLPVALAFAKKFPHTIGFDINQEKVQALKQGIDSTGEIEQSELKNSTLQITANLEDLAPANFFIVAVPTPIDCNHRPDLTSLIQASKIIGKVLQPGAIVVYESTVYPGVTEDICGALLAEISGLKQSIDFKLGYSPERINPGDKSHTLEKIIKVVAGEDQESLETISRIYNTIIDAGIYQATSIKVAETAKVIENTQRDLNIALMNELALICDRLGIRTHEVLLAANTKWNFLPFTPGLVGGHCIGVDPYYLTTKAEELGYHPQVILAGRRINDSMGAYIGQRLVKLLVQANLPIKGAKVGVFGLTFKENVPDLRNSRVPDIITELQQFGINPLVHDPIANPQEAQREYGIDLVSLSQLLDLDALIFAVSHQFYLDRLPILISCINLGGVLMDIKSAIEPTTITEKNYVLELVVAVLKTYIPWWIKLSAKVILARLPIPYNFWKNFALIAHGNMDEPSYAYQVFIQHFNRFTPKKKEFISLEIGPGDSLFSALITKAHGGVKSYLVDIGDFADKDIKKYKAMAQFLNDKNLPIKNIENCQNLANILDLCSASYLTSGLSSLKNIPDRSIDFIWSHGVIELIRLSEISDTFKELRRIIKPDGICSHLIPLVDSLGALNSLRFSQDIWESNFMANSGFYANRLRYSQILELFKEADFTVEVVQIKRWDALPTPKSKLSKEFIAMSDEELSVYSFSVILQPA